MRGGRSRRAMSDINVVPYIDVMLVLLVIFMVTAPLVAPSIVNLPTVGSAAPQQQTPPWSSTSALERQHERALQGRRGARSSRRT